MTAIGTDSDLLALERQVCFALSVANRSVLAVYRPILEPMGLTHPQYLVMLALWERSPRTAADIGRTLQFDPATLSPLLKRLEAAGFVSRTRRADNEREIDVALTASGRRLRRKAERVPPTVIEKLGMELRELEELRAALHRLNGAARSGPPR